LNTRKDDLELCHTTRVFILQLHLYARLYYNWSLKGA